MLKVENLLVEVGSKTVLKGTSLKVRPGEVVGLMGPNGSGKSSLAKTLMGDSRYRVRKGRLSLDGKSLLRIKAEERVREGLFVGWQSPVGVRGVTVEQLLRAAVIKCRNLACKRTGQEEKCVSVAEFRQELAQEARKLGIKTDWLRRELSGGFSGGEKKKLELLQGMMLRPRYMVLDEIDSGLDVDGLRLVGEQIKNMKQRDRQMGLVLISHYRRIFEQVKPDRVGVMKAGKIVRWGDQRVVEQVDKEGYGKIK
jgi:Fe-S cluster assembly ATP-binding protein